MEVEDGAAGVGVAAGAGVGPSAGVGAWDLRSVGAGPGCSVGLGDLLGGRDGGVEISGVPVGNWNGISSVGRSLAQAIPEKLAARITISPAAMRVLKFIR